MANTDNPQSPSPATMEPGASQQAGGKWKVVTKNTFVELKSHEQLTQAQELDMGRAKTWAVGADGHAQLSQGSTSVDSAGSDSHSQDSADVVELPSTYLRAGPGGVAQALPAARSRPKPERSQPDLALAEGDEQGEGLEPLVEEDVLVVPRGPDEVTVMLRNIPVQVELSPLLQVFDSVGLHAQYDLVYLPMDFRAQTSLGFAFVNLVSARAYELFSQHFDRQPFVLPDGQRVPGKNLSVALAKVQGVLGNVAEFRDSPVMSGKVQDNFKPHLFDEEGNSIPFPAPTKKLKRLKLRKNAKARPGCRPRVEKATAAGASSSGAAVGVGS